MDSNHDSSVRKLMLLVSDGERESILPVTMTSVFRVHLWQERSKSPSKKDK